MRDKRERMHGEVSGECDGSILSLIPHPLSLERIRQKAILFPLWPLRLARSRTQDFHSCNTGSNPVGVTRRSGESPPPIAFLAELIFTKGFTTAPISSSSWQSWWQIAFVLQVANLVANLRL